MVKVFLEGKEITPTNGSSLTIKFINTQGQGWLKRDGHLDEFVWVYDGV